MNPCSELPNIHLLHDGELPSDAQPALRSHLAGCAECTAELAELQLISPALAQLNADTQLSMIEQARLQQRVDGEISGSQWTELYRTARMLSAIAASIVLISCIWLFEIPSGHTTAVSPAVVAVSPRDFLHNDSGTDSALATGKEIPAWERIAETLRVDPRPEDGGAFDIGVADARQLHDNFRYETNGGAAENSVADWIVSGLSNGPGGSGIGSGHASP